MTEGIMYFIVNTHTIFGKLPETASRKPHLPFPSIPVYVVLGDAIIRVHPSVVALFQHKWQWTIQNILLV